MKNVLKYFVLVLIIFTNTVLTGADEDVDLDTLDTLDSRMSSQI